MKTIRTWVYAILKYKENIVVILKKRWPFTGLYDLPGGKIEHWENHIFSLKRELEEEIWLHENDYEVNIISENLNLDFIENGWDSAGLKLISINNLNFPKTNILQKALDKIHSI